MSREGIWRHRIGPRATVLGVSAILVITGTTVATRAHGWKTVTAATATGAHAVPLLRCLRKVIRSRSSTYQQARGAVGLAWCAPSHSCTHHIGCLTAFFCCWCVTTAISSATGDWCGYRQPCLCHRRVRRVLRKELPADLRQRHQHVEPWTKHAIIDVLSLDGRVEQQGGSIGLHTTMWHVHLARVLRHSSTVVCCGGLPLIHLGALSVRSRYIAVGASDPNAVRAIWGCFWENRSLSLRRRWKHKLIRTLKIQHGLGSHARTDYNDASSDSCPRRYRATRRQHVVVWR